MNKQRNYIIFILFFIFILIIYKTTYTTLDSKRQRLFSPVIQYVVYLPTIYGNTQIVGYQMDHDNSQLVADETPAWAVILEPIRLYDVIQKDDTYYWSWIDKQQKILEGKVVIYSIKNVPEQWREFPAYHCSKPKKIYWQNYVDFVLAIHNRYKSSHNIIAYEIWNEPNAPIQVFPANEPYGIADFFGCWGNRDYPDMDGKSYGEFYKFVNQKLKQSGITVPILFGAWNGSDSSESILFVKESLKTAGEIDAFSYHAYASYGNDKTWDIVYNRARLLETMTSAPLWLTETALQYRGDMPTTEFRNKQAEYLTYILQRNPDLPCILWYQSENVWMWVGMRDGYEKYPVWNTFVSLYPSSMYPKRLKPYP